MEDWKNFYPDIAEAHTSKKLEPLGEPVTIWVYVDANHVGNLLNSKSHSGILIYVNNALIKFHRKRQNKVEPSSSSLEFVALRIDTDMV